MVPQVPPLPMGLSLPSHSSISLVFPSLGQEADKPYKDESDLRGFTLSSSKPTSNLTFSNCWNSVLSHWHQKSPLQIGCLWKIELLQCSRYQLFKFSFLSASLKHSPRLRSSSFPLSPYLVIFSRWKSLSNDHGHLPSTVSPRLSWSPIQSNVVASVASLASMSSVDSGRFPQYPKKHQTALQAVQVQNQVQAIVRPLTNV